MLGSAARKVKRKILDILKDRDVIYDQYDKHYYSRIRGESKVDLVHRSEVPEDQLAGKHRQMKEDELEERPEVEPDDDLDDEDEKKLMDQVDNPRRSTHLDYGKQMLSEARQYSYSQELPSQTARKAGNNRFIMSDVMNDPSIIDAGSRVEAKAMIDAAQPGNTSTSYSEVAAEGNSGDSGEAGDSGEVSVADNPGPSTDVDAYAEAANSSSGDSAAGDGNDSGDVAGMGDSGGVADGDVGGMGDGGM